MAHLSLEQRVAGYDVIEEGTIARILHILSCNYIREGEGRDSIPHFSEPSIFTDLVIAISLSPARKQTKVSKKNSKFPRMKN